MFITNNLRAILKTISFKMVVQAIVIFTLVGCSVGVYERLWNIRSPRDLPLFLLPNAILVFWASYIGQFIPSFRRQWRTMVGSILILLPIPMMVVIDEFEFTLVRHILGTENYEGYAWWYEHISSRYILAMHIFLYVAWAIVLWPSKSRLPTTELRFRLALQHRIVTMMIWLAYSIALTCTGVFLAGLWYHEMAASASDWQSFWYQSGNTLDWLLGSIFVTLTIQAWHIKRLERIPGSYTWAWMLAGLIGFLLIGAIFTVWVYTFYINMRIATVLGLQLLGLSCFFSSLLWLWHIEKIPFETLSLQEMLRRGIIPLELHRFKRRQKQMEPEQEQD